MHMQVAVICVFIKIQKEVAAYMIHFLSCTLPFVVCLFFPKKIRDHRQQPCMFLLLPL